MTRKCCIDILRMVKTDPTRLRWARPYLLKIIKTMNQIKAKKKYFLQTFIRSKDRIFRLRKWQYVFPMVCLIIFWDQWNSKEKKSTDEKNKVKNCQGKNQISSPAWIFGTKKDGKKISNYSDAWNQNQNYSNTPFKWQNLLKFIHSELQHHNWFNNYRH